MVDKYGTGQDPYCYKGTDILINNFDIRDEETLQEAEREFTTAALNNIEFLPPPYDLSYLQDLHSLLFSHIYSWAGEIRTIDISKQDTRFCTSTRIEPEANKIFHYLEAENYFENEDHDSFIMKIAELYADLNMIHPFREGNGRVQRLLFEHIALNCGYSIDWDVASTEEWISANIHGVNCNFKPIEDIFRAALQEAA